MYEINQQVFIKQPEYNCTGNVIDRGYSRDSTGHRRAWYLVAYGAPNHPVRDVIVRSKDLRAADQFCDGCQKWYPYSSFNDGGEYRNPYDGVIEVKYCFLCTRDMRKSGW